MRVRASVIGVGLLAGGLAWGVGACSDSLLETGGGVLDITLTVTPLSATVGDSVVVETQAVGTSLIGTIIDFGNGRVDSIQAFGAQTQGNRVTNHFYSLAGSYTVRATVQDSSQGTLSAEAVVLIIDP